MRVLATRLDGLVAIEPARFADERGFFCETYRGQWHEQLGIAEASASSRTTTRAPRAASCAACTSSSAAASRSSCAARAGGILDVAVDLRRGSPTYGQWDGMELDDESMRELFVPVGFAHGFCVLSDVADVIYKQTAYYDPELERGIAWNDPEVGIEWPLPASELIVSERDAAAPPLRELEHELPFVYEGA